MLGSVPVLLVPFGAFFPGDPPGGDTSGALGAPSGAGALTALSEDIGWVVGDICVPCAAGADVPGEFPAGASTGVFGAPVGAGAEEFDCAKAMLATAKNATEIRLMRRILFSWSEYFVLQIEQVGRADPACNRGLLSPALNRGYWGVRVAGKLLSVRISFLLDAL